MACEDDHPTMGEPGVSEAKEFGASLRAERERRGISLDVIAQKTKVSASVLAGLEKGDLSRWPSGIFRRAFLRAYASAVGLDVDGTLAEFLRVFPEDGRAKPRAAAVGHSSSTLRLALGEHLHPLADRRRVVGVGIDVAVPLTVLALALAGAPGGVIVALFSAVLWHAVGSLFWGMSPGLWLMRPRVGALRPVAEPAPLVLASPPASAEVIRLTPQHVPPVMTGPRGRVTRRLAPVRQERENRVSR